MVIFSGVKRPVFHADIGTKKNEARHLNVSFVLFFFFGFVLFYKHKMAKHFLCHFEIVRIFINDSETFSYFIHKQKKMFIFIPFRDSHPTM